MQEFFDYTGEVRRFDGEYFPHIQVECGIYFVTFCLEDAVPRKKLKRLKRRRERTVERLRRQNKLTRARRRRIDDAYHEEVDKVLDAGRGERWLERDEVAQIVADSFEYFHRERYDLDVWTIMGTHVHMTVRTRPTWWLSDVVHSWKSYTGTMINRALGREDEKVWQADYFDRLVRSEAELKRYRKYVWENPENAGLENWQWRRQYARRWRDDEEVDGSKGRAS